MESRHRVAEAWASGQVEFGANVSTDGRVVRSYAHVVGITEPDGRKVAFSCRYSKTTAKHCSAFKEVADEVRDCTHVPGTAIGPHD